MTSWRAIIRATDQQIDQLCTNTGVESKLAAKVLAYARRLALPNDPNHIDENCFLGQLFRRFGMTNTFMMHLTFELYKIRPQNVISVIDYATLVCTYLSPDIVKQIDLVFRVYDYNKDNYLGKPEFSTFIGPHAFFSRTEDTELDVRDLQEFVMSTCDTDYNGVIDLQEYREYVKKNKLFLELLGPALPNNDMLRKFTDLLATKNISQIRDLFVNERQKCTRHPIQKSNKFGLFPVELEIP